MAHPTLVPRYAESSDGSPSTYHARFEEPAAQGKTLSSASASQTAASFSDSFIRATLTDRGLSQQAQELLSNSWREGTKKQYDTTARRWRAYCGQREIDSLTPPVIEVVNFLTSLFEGGLGYGGVASARSTLGHVITVPGCPKLADHPLIQRLLKGIGNVRPPKPCYTMIWDTTPQLCPVRLIHVYLEKRKSLPLTTVYDEFFLTHQKPHHPATTDTLARWVKSVLHLSGVNIDTYKPHSYRSASTSHAKSAGVPLEDILRAGQWKSSDCFTTFYDREIERTDFTATQPFAESILNALSDSD